MSKEIDSLEESIRHNTNTPESTAQSLSRMKSLLQGNLHEIGLGDVLTFQMTNFSQLRKEKKVWHSPPFSIGDKVRVRLAVYPNGVGKGQGSHVSVLFILMEVIHREERILLQYNMSVAALGQHRSATPKTLELYSTRMGDSEVIEYQMPWCSAYFPCPSPGDVMLLEDLFLEIEEASSLLMHDAMMLELKLFEHQHRQ